MNKILIIDGNSILNRAFFGITGSKTLMTEDGTYTNAIYGFLAILFKTIEDINPQYLSIAFDLKKPTFRHELYSEYKATRKGMPEELASQLPILKDILRAMNITIIEKEGYEADDILGTLSRISEKSKLDVTLLSGDRDNFQLITNRVHVRIPRTIAGKTETEEYTVKKVKENYGGLNPKQLIEVKGLMGDTSDNIPGIAGVGEKTAIKLIQEYKSIDNLYDAIEKEDDDLKGKLREKIIAGKEMAYLSRELGTINVNIPLEINIEDLRIKEWNNNEVLKIFKKLRFSRYISRFNLESYEEETQDINDLYETVELSLNNCDCLIKMIEKYKKIYYFLQTKNVDNVAYIIKKEITNIYILNEEDKKIYYIDVEDKEKFKKTFEDIFKSENILKCGYKQKEDYILLKQTGIIMNKNMFDIEIAGYLLNSVSNKYTIKKLAEEHLKIDFENYLKQIGGQEENEQLTFFENQNEKESTNFNAENSLNLYCIYKLHDILENKLKENNAISLFYTIEIPLVIVLAEMQYEGIFIDKEELCGFGEILKERINILVKEIYELSGEEFNINSPKQLGDVLFNKLKLHVYKKTKSGYSTDVEILEKLKKEHPVIEKILEYRQISKLNSTFVQGIKPYINEHTERIHSHFHQTVTATGRISSTEPNLQNIPTRIKLGKKLRKVFKPKENCIFLDADYSQIELRVLAHIAEDKNMIEAFNNDEDIHTQVASKVFNVSIEEVSKELRTKAKAVNFGIVYGISDYGLGEQINVTRKEAKQYIDQYLEKYSGIKKFMETTVEKAKKQGYVETLFNRRRYVPELKSNNYTLRQFGSRVAMNTPIQGTAADIIKLAMINVYEEIKNNNLKSRIILQIHDELLLEVPLEEKDLMGKILVKSMENVINLKVPLKAELSEGNNWYEVK